MNESTDKAIQNGRRRGITLLGIAVSVVFLLLAFRGLQPDAFLTSLGDVHVGLLLVGALSYFIAVMIIAWRWQFLLNSVGRVSLLPLTQIVAIGYMGNNVYPLRAGEALRIYLLRRNHHLPIGGTATTVVVERVFDGIVMLSFILLALLRLDVQSDAVQLVASVGTPIFLVAVLLFFALANFPAVLEALVKRVAARLPDRLAEIVLQMSGDALQGLSGLRSPAQLAGALLTSYATWAVEALVYWIVMFAFGLNLPYAAALLVVGTVNLAGLLPASPGQVGVYEFFASAVLIGLTVPDDTALAYAIVVHLVIWLPVTLVGFGLLVRQGLGLSDIAQARQLEAGANGRPNSNPQAAAYWQNYLAGLPQDHAHRSADYTAWGFGDSAAMADELGQLVREGKKTATASLLWAYEHDEEPLPQVGDLSVILDGKKQPLCIIETTEIRILPFNTVDAQFAYDEGEGDRSLAYWREVHRHFFSRSCARIGRSFNESMPIVCERFRVVDKA